MIRKLANLSSLAIAQLLLIAVPPAFATESDMALQDLLESYRQSERFLLPERRESDAAGTVFRQMMDGSSVDLATVAEAGLELPLADSFSIAADRGDAPAGRGFFVLRSTGRAVLLSAPHQFRDLGTGIIAAQLMETMDFRGLAVNTAPRDLGVPGIAGDSDLSDLSDTHFNAFHLAFFHAHPAGRVVQLHGFAKEKRRSRAGREAEVILSSGSADPTDGVRQMAECLTAMGLRTLVYPQDVQELGGTTNSNLAALRAAGAPNGYFVHVEMSAETRKELRRNPDAFFVFGTCLGAGL